MFSKTGTFLRRNALIIILAIVFCVVPLGPSLAGGDVEIVRTGLWHGDEVHVDAEGAWWGLFPTAKGTYELLPATVRIQPAHDGIMDAEGEATGKQVSTSRERVPLILLKGLEDPVEGPVETLFVGPLNRFLYPGESTFLRLKNGNAVSLVALGKAEETEHGISIGDYVLKLRGAYGDEINQTIASFPVVDLDGPPSLIWAGDLDKDGRVDLLMNLTTHYNLTALTLFLSSEAGEGNHVRKAAHWRTSGC